MNYKISYMQTPTLTFEEVTMLTSTGKAVMADQHSWAWEPIIVAFENHDEVWDFHVNQSGGLFSFTFQTPTGLWELTDCQLLHRCNPRINEFLISYKHAFLTEV